MIVYIIIEQYVNEDPRILKVFSKADLAMEYISENRTKNGPMLYIEEYMLDGDLE